MHAQEVPQEVLAPQEHASGKKKLNCAFIRKKFQTQEVQNPLRKKPQEVQNPIRKKPQEVASPIANRK